ncbi:toxin-antitoxin system YwqK family antitoxin [Xanthomonas sp. NCPPB 2632]|uniref:toxin-antitoxin system YwqK family antitoxin n=1 Tax=Xanthomonas sp. NCPPB 2632 TaxID=3240912 RepID=UPI0035133FA7
MALEATGPHSYRGKSVNLSSTSGNARAGSRAARLLTAFVTTALLAACGHSTVPSQQLDYNNGLAYLHGETDPFKGVAHYEPAPDFISRSLMGLAMHSPGFNSTIYADACDVAFEKGVEEGDVRCASRDGVKALTLTIHHNRLDGEAIAYNKNGDKLSETNWKDGSMDGSQTFYSADGKYVTHSFKLENGHRRGKELWRAQNGDELAEGSWGSDGKFNGSGLATPNFDSYYEITTYDDNEKDGPYFWNYGFGSKHVILEGQYKDGQKDGEWKYHGEPSTIPFVAFNDVLPGAPGRKMMALTSLNDSAAKTVTFDKGHLSGPVTVLDKDDHVLLSFVVENDAIKGPIKRLDPASARKETYEDSAVIAAVNWQVPEDLQQLRIDAAAVRGPNTPRTPDPRIAEIEKAQDWQSEVNRAIAEVRQPVKPAASPDAATLPVEAAPAPAAPPEAKAPATPPAPLAVAAPPKAEATDAASFADAPAVADTDPATGACVDGWVTAFHKEQGADAPIAADQLQEWQEWCKAGKKAP